VIRCNNDIADAKRECNNQLALSETKHLSEINDIKASHKQQVEDNNSKHIKDIEELKSLHDNNMRTVQLEHANNIERIRSENTDMINKLKREHAEELDDTNKKHTATLDKFKARFKEEIIKKNTTIESHETKITELNKALEGLKLAHEQEISMFKNERELLLTDLQDKHNTAITELKRKHKEELDQLRGDYDKVLRESEELKKKLAASEKFNSTQVKDVETLGNELAAIDEKHKSLDIQYKQLLADYKQLQVQYDTLNKVNQIHIAEINNQKRLVSEREQTIQHLEGELKRAKTVDFGKDGYDKSGFDSRGYNKTKRDKFGHVEGGYDLTVALHHQWNPDTYVSDIIDLNTTLCSLVNSYEVAYNAWRTSESSSDVSFLINYNQERRKLNRTNPPSYEEELAIQQTFLNKITAVSGIYYNDNNFVAVEGFEKPADVNVRKSNLSGKISQNGSAYKSIAETYNKHNNKKIHIILSLGNCDLSSDDNPDGGLSGKSEHILTISTLKPFIKSISKLIESGHLTVTILQSKSPKANASVMHNIIAHSGLLADDDKYVIFMNHCSGIHGSVHMCMDMINAHSSDFILDDKIGMLAYGSNCVDRLTPKEGRLHIDFATRGFIPQSYAVVWKTQFYKQLGFRHHPDYVSDFLLYGYLLLYEELTDKIIINNSIHVKKPNSKEDISITFDKVMHMTVTRGRFTEMHPMDLNDDVVKAITSLKPKHISNYEQVSDLFRNNRRHLNTRAFPTPTSVVSNAISGTIFGDQDADDILRKLYNTGYIVEQSYLSYHYPPIDINLFDTGLGAPLGLRNCSVFGGGVDGADKNGDVKGGIKIEGGKGKLLRFNEVLFYILFISLVILIIVIVVSFVKKMKNGTGRDSSDGGVKSKSGWFK
jgi:hypothetical protein